MMNQADYEKKAAALEAILVEEGCPKADLGNLGVAYLQIPDGGVFGGGATVGVSLSLDGEVKIAISWPSTHYSIEDANKVLAQHSRAVAIARVIATRAQERV